MRDFSVSNDFLDRPEDLRARAAEDGYLFFRGLLPPHDLMAVRGDILGLCADAGWLKDRTDPVEAFARPGRLLREGQSDYMAVYNEVLKLESFNTLAHHPALLSIFGALFEEPVLVHARNIARIVFPNAALYTTPAHQDNIHIRGSEETWTSWFPLGDCPREMGSLAVLPGRRTELLPIESSYGTGGKGIPDEYLQGEWAASDFHNGDVLLFHSLTVHKALPNLSPDRIRISVDYRYQPASHKAAEDSFEPHYAQVTWDEVYAGWKDTRYQYYWEGIAKTAPEPGPQV